MAKGVLILPSYHEAIKDLSETDRLAMYDSIVRYGLYGETPELSAILNSLFTLIKAQIDSSQRRYDAAVENGRKGGRPRKKQTENHNKNQSKNQSGNQDYDYDLDYDYDSSGFRKNGELPPWQQKALEDMKHE